MDPIDPAVKRPRELSRRTFMVAAGLDTRLSCTSAMPTWDEVESMADDPDAWTAE